MRYDLPADAAPLACGDRLSAPPGLGRARTQRRRALRRSALARLRDCLASLRTQLTDQASVDADGARLESQGVHTSDSYPRESALGEPVNGGSPCTTFLAGAKEATMTEFLAMSDLVKQGIPHWSSLSSWPQASPRLCICDVEPAPLESAALSLNKRSCDLLQIIAQQSDTMENILAVYLDSFTEYQELDWITNEEELYNFQCILIDNVKALYANGLIDEAACDYYEINGAGLRTLATKPG